MRKVTKIYLVRHCESEGNKIRIFQGQYNTDISEKGAKQLERLANRFKDIKLDKIYASSLTRAYKTAKAVADTKNMEVLIDNAFIEINLGNLDGKPWDYIFDNNPDLKQAWYHEPHNFSPPGGETMREVYSRAKDGLKKLIESPENEGKSILIATHGCLLRNLLCSVLFDDITRLGEVPGSSNTAVTLLICDEQGVKVDYQGDCSHLPDELVSSLKKVFTEDKDGK